LWEKRLKELFGLAGITKGQGNAVSHRLRDTFGVALLLAGVPIERVSVLLGHQSVPVTEKHYNPWVRSRQEQLEADVARAWKLDPVLKTKNFGKNQVHFSEGVGELNENKGAKLEARVGIEPTHKGFADLSLTTWVPRLNPPSIAKFFGPCQRRTVTAVPQPPHRRRC